MELEDKIVMLGETFVMHTNIHSLNKSIIQVSLYKDSMDSDNLLHRFVARYDKREGNHMREIHDGILSSFVKLFKRNRGDIEKSIEGVDKKAYENRIREKQEADRISKDMASNLQTYLDKNIKDIAILSDNKLYFTAQEDLIDHANIEKNIRIFIEVLMKNIHSFDNLIGNLKVSYVSYRNYQIVLYVIGDSSIDACAIITDKKNFGQTIKRSEDIISHINGKLEMK